MEIKKGQILEITHNRKGRFLAKAREDFSTDDFSYPVATLEPVKGMDTDWIEGESIPCKSQLVSSLKVVDDDI